VIDIPGRTRGILVFEMHVISKHLPDENLVTARQKRNFYTPLNYRQHALREHSRMQASYSL
jgi:hypothetical protein